MSKCTIGASISRLWFPDAAMRSDIPDGPCGSNS
jgi:hypothetical protein